MNNSTFKRNLIRFLLISAGIYGVCFGQFLLMYDYIDGWNSSISFNLKNDMATDKYMFKVFPDTNIYLRCRYVILSFDKNRSVTLYYNSNQKWVGCDFNDPHIDYTYRSFKEMHDSIKSILSPVVSKENLTLAHGRIDIEVKEHTIFWWYAFRTFYLSLVKKPYLTIFPIVFVFSFFLWDNPEKWLGRHRRKESTDSLPNES